MGVFINRRSPYYWLYLERPGQRGIRESTMIPVTTGSSHVRRRNRRLAEDIYAIRMGEMARDRLLAARDTKTVSTFTHPIPAPPPLTVDGWCYVYFIQCGPAVKIGRTTHVQKRLESLRTASHEDVQLLAATLAHASLEGALHRRFAHLKRSGEWFWMSDEIRAYIDSVNQGENPIAWLMSTETAVAASA